MRIAMVTPYALGGVSGVAEVMLSLGREFTRRGHVVSIVSPQPSPLESIHEVSIHAVRLSRSFASLSLALRTAGFLWRHRGQWSVVHLHQGHLQTIVCAILARTLGRPAVTTFHLLPPQARGLRGLLERVWIRLTLRLSSRCVFVSEHTKRTFRRPGQVIRNGVDLEKLSRSLGDRAEVRRELGLEGFVIAFTGRLTENKGFLDLLDAVKRVGHNGREVRLLTTGEGLPVDRGKIEGRIRSLGLEGHVCALGPRPDHLRFLVAADAMALPSYAEGLPMALLEGMAAGLPIIATNVGGITEIIRDGVEGFLVEPGNVSQLARRIEELATDPKLCSWMSSASMRAALSYDSGHMAAAYLDVFQVLIDG